MKRMILAGGSLFILTLLLFACGSRGTKDIISAELGIDVSSCDESSNFENHGGFHGDGKTYIALSFSDDKALEQIKESTNWQEFPLDRTTRVLVYGISDVTSSMGPFLNDGNGNPLVPVIQNGYYLLIDRHAGTESDILHRGSFNFTLGLYDIDTDTLYYCKFDT